MIRSGVLRLAGACALVACLLSTPAAQAGRILGIDFAETSAAGPEALPLRGLATLRVMRWVEVSVAALYVREGVPAADVLSDVPRRLEIEYLRGFRASDFARSTRWFVERNVGKERYAALEANIEIWNSLYRDVERGDRYALTYAPGLGTELALNGVVLGSLPGAELSSALFSIWLGKRPLDAGFKADLLAVPQKG